LNAVSTGPRRRISIRQIDAGDRCDRQEISIVAPRAHATADLIGDTCVTTTAAPTPADTELLAFGDSINAEAQDFVDNLTAGDEDLIESATYSWDSATATVSLGVAFAPSYAYPLDTAAWILARDRAMDLWNRDSPFRAEGATIRPSLEIVVNDARYVSDFNLCLRVADQTIAIDDWVRASHRS